MKNLLHRFKQLVKPAELPVAENTACKNCETVFTGKFCPECGQSVNDFDKPFGFIMVNFLGDFFAFDTRFFRTLKALVFNPGLLAIRFFEGKRAPFAPPVRIFIFSSFVMFLLLQWQTNRIFNESIQSESASETINSTVSENLPNTIEKTAQNETIVNDSIIAMNLDAFIFGGLASLRQQLSPTVEVLQKKLETTENEEEKKEIRQLIRTLSDPQMMVNKVLKLMSWAFFLLLPVFALILKLFYIRVHFIRHLIFSMYMHSFIFIILTIIVFLGIVFNSNSGWLISAMLLTIPIYLVIAMKNFYGQKVLLVLPRFIGVTILYNIIFFVVLLLVVLNAMLII